MVALERRPNIADVQCCWYVLDFKAIDLDPPVLVGHHSYNVTIVIGCRKCIGSRSANQFGQPNTSSGYEVARVSGVVERDHKLLRVVQSDRVSERDGLWYGVSTHLIVL